MFRSKRFRDNWILILIISSIPGLIFGGMIYWLGGERLENELLQMHNKQIQLKCSRLGSYRPEQHVSYLLGAWQFMGSLYDVGSAAYRRSHTSVLYENVRFVA